VQQWKRSKQQQWRLNNRMQPKEKLSFKVGLSGTYWDKKPAYSISIDGVEQVSAFITSDSGVTEYQEFSVEVEEDIEHTLEIRLLNKANTDTVQNSDKTEILKDLLLNIDSIEIEEIELGELKWDATKFVPDNSLNPIVERCVNLGWNGTYILSFNSPFYLWLLEKM
jgi:hypothetical protein